MTRTTPPRPIDIEAVFPELAAHRGTTTRLHPRPGHPGVGDSSVGGPMLWPADEPWPTCSKVHGLERGRRPGDIHQMKCAIINEAGPGWTQLGSRIERAVADVAPVVQERSTLFLGESITVRLLTPRALARVLSAEARQSFQEMQVTGWRGRLATGIIGCLPYVLVRLTWPCIHAMYSPTPEGGEIRFMPAITRHMSIDDRELARVLRACR